VPPLPQSAFVVQVFVVQNAAEQTSLVLVPQSAFEPQGTVVHFALLHGTPVGHWASLAQTAALHLAPLQSLLTPQALSLAQLVAVHLALLHTLLTPQPASAVQAAVPHLAPLHLLDTEQPVSPAQLTVEHLAPLQVLLAPHDKLSPQALVPLHFALHTEPEELQSASMEQAEAVEQVKPEPQFAFEVQAWPIFGPLEQVREQVPLVEPQMPVSQSACL
jgi:hypothetical protein